MALSDEMRRLTQHFLGSYDDRMAAVADIRTATGEELAELRAAHGAMATELRVRLDEQESGRLAQAAEDARGRAEYVDELRSDTAALLKELDAAHQAMAAELRAHLDEQESRRLAQAAEDARGRMEYVDNLRASVNNLLQEFDAAHQAMATELRARLDEQESGRLAQAAEDVRERAEYVTTLKSDTAAMLSEFQAELSEARQVWSSFNTLMQQRRARKPAAPPPPPPPVEEVVAPPPPVEAAPPPPPVEEVAPPPEVAEEEVAPDDLTTIRGIGPGMQQHLNEAGIQTFAQLAASTPEELRHILGDAGRLARVEEWIEQARELAG